MDSFLTTLYFTYFRAQQRTNELKQQNTYPKATGEFDVIGLQLETSLIWEEQLKKLLTEYTLILKSGGK